MMNGSDLASTTASSPKSKEDQVVNGHDEKENNPFAEYMWMENEEDFNRQRDSDSTIVISCGTRDLHLPQAQLEGEGQRKNQCLKSESILSLAISAASPGG
ncbi:polyadenylate-binding protein-interacting protein 2B isoform X2 [Egretta garzetta]|uniref:polyadenylate-binding protein-interacting protein 2B isoform X2 n=1 Tax=Egretta garzetta TaxID=188379 RepID=UPI00163BE5AA|nr:polyadenylate-binding protein-interacting protein 2B isoform X2 [Egretta garzetta]